MSKKLKRTGTLSFLLFSLIGAFAGFLIVYITTKMSGDDLILKNNLPGFIFNLLLLFLAVVTAIYAQIIIHEVGHLVFGLNTGYQFVSFRVGNLTLIKRSGKYMLKRYYVPGTGGQCFMMPPESSDNNLPYKLYNLGGVIFNFISSIIAILLVLLFDLPVFLNVFFLSFAIFGLIFGILNGIPMKISGIANDGYNIRLLNNDKISRKAFHLQLKVNGLQSEGIRIKDMPENWFELPDDANMNNNLNLSIKILKSSWYMDQLRFDEARQCLESIEPYKNNLIGLYQKERDCELLFLEIIGNCRPDIIASLYTDEIKKYIEQYSKYMFSKKRILYTYTIAVENDKQRADKIFNEAIKMQDKYPLLGEAESELEIMEYVRKRYL